MFQPGRLLVQPEWDEREAWYRLARRHALGVELISFALTGVVNDPAAEDEHREAYRRELPSLPGARTLHGPYVDIVPHSQDRAIAEASRGRIAACLETAAALEASHVVFHTGVTWRVTRQRYLDGAAAAHAEWWTALLERFPGVTVCLENLWEPSPSLLRRILELAGHPRLKVCLDVGHANVFGAVPIEAWTDELGGGVAYLHLNDNHGRDDDELALGRGSIDWPRVFAALRTLPAAPLAVLEVNSLAAVAESLAVLARYGVYEWPEEDGAETGGGVVE
jgi:sugar phosphate isomerase/epimerase